MSFTKVRAPKRTLLLALLIYLILLGFKAKSGAVNINEGIVTGIHLTLDKEAQKFIASMPTPKQRFSTSPLQNMVNCGGNWTSYGPKSNCNTYTPPLDLLANASIRICEKLAGKRILFLGPLTTYYLHDIWLETLEHHEGHPITCPGPEYCVFHHICFPGRNASSHMDGRNHLFPKNKELQETRSAVLQYVLSTSLVAHPDKGHDIYTRPTVDPVTGVRMRNYFWLRKAQKAGIIILGLAPIPAPAWTYARYLRQNHRSYLKNMLPWRTPTLERDLVAQALNTTVSSFLPSLKEALRAIQGDPQIEKSLIIWHGHWPMDPACTNSGLPKHVPRILQFWTLDRGSVDPWTFYYNFQIYLHDWMLPKILPHFNILYLPLAISPNSEPTAAPVPGRKDCIRQGRDGLETRFFSTLFHILELYNTSPARGRSK